MVQTVQSVSANRLLAAMPEGDARALEPKLEYYRLAAGRSLHEPGEAPKHVVFPLGGIVSLLYVSERGASAELALVGREGMVGLGPLLGAPLATARAMVRVAGSAYRLRTSDALALFNENPRFRSVVLRYAQLRMQQLSQAAICHQHHVVEQQLCRWLLSCLDRIEGNEIDTTHELIAGMLGVRRQGVTEAAGRLQERSIIVYSRGRIAVLDRGALERGACECYRLLKRQAAALLGEPPA